MKTQTEKLVDQVQEMIVHTPQQADIAGLLAQCAIALAIDRLADMMEDISTAIGKLK